MTSFDVLIHDSPTREMAMLRLWGYRSFFEKKLFNIESLGGFYEEVPSEIVQEVNADNLYSKLEEWEKQIKDVPVLNLTLSFEPSGSELREILKRAREIFECNLFISCIADAKILGGSVVVWRGRLSDQSIRKRINSENKIWKLDS